MEVFEAEIEDIPELCDLLGYLFEHEVEFKPDISLQSCGLQKILENNDRDHPSKLLSKLLIKEPRFLYFSKWWRAGIQDA